MATPKLTKAQYDWLLGLAAQPGTDSLTLGLAGQQLGLDAGTVFNIQYAGGAMTGGDVAAALAANPSLAHLSEANIVQPAAPPPVKAAAFAVGTILGGFGLYKLLGKKKRKR